MLEFFDGRQCRQSPGQLPKACLELMNAQKGKKSDSFTVGCQQEGLIPENYFFLSDQFLLATVEGDMICLKRARN